MSRLFEAKLAPLTIPASQSVSNVWLANVVFEDASFIIIYSPLVMDALTFTLQVTDDPTGQVVIYNTFQLGDTPTDANLPAAGRARAYLEPQGAGGIRIMSSSNVSVDHVFRATKVWKA